jgi:hypothetical protein
MTTEAIVRTLQAISLVSALVSISFAVLAIIQAKEAVRLAGVARKLVGMKN